jgi:hypothetical protein
MQTEGYWKLFWGLIPINFEDTSWYSPLDTPYVVTEKQIIVPAGTFDGYKINIGWNDYYYIPEYSPEIGNVAKFSLYLPHGDSGVLYLSLDLALKSTTYTP